MATDTITLTVGVRWWLVPSALLWRKVSRRQEPPDWLWRLWGRYAVYVVRK